MLCLDYKEHYQFLCCGLYLVSVYHHYYYYYYYHHHQHQVTVFLRMDFSSYSGIKGATPILLDLVNWATVSVEIQRLRVANYIEIRFSQSISLPSTLILFFLLHLCPLSGLFPCGFQIKIFNAFLNSAMNATCPTHLNFLDFITEYKIWSSS
jgi:hypothetical protein